MTSLTDAARRLDDTRTETDPFKLSDSPSHLLRRAQQFATEIFVKAGVTDGVTLRQSVILAAIAEAEGRTQSELVRATGVDRSTLADMMVRMEAKGLIARSAAAADGRAKSVSLTPAGRARLNKALPAMRCVDEALIASLPKNRQKSFCDTLGALSLAADAAHIEEADGVRQAKKAAKARKAADRARKKRKKKKKARRH
jgi:MarR family transcriptional regulator, temperature-dependent positive regulator of motility